MTEMEKKEKTIKQNDFVSATDSKHYSQTNNSQ